MDKSPLEGGNPPCSALTFRDILIYGFHKCCSLVVKSQIELIGHDLNIYSCRIRKLEIGIPFRYRFFFYGSIELCIPTISLLKDVY